MRALVTGGAGFIGSAVARVLLERGDEVRVLDNLLTGLEVSVPREAALVLGDLRDIDAIRDACRDIEVVFHQAALRSVPRSVDDPVLSAECNIMGTLNLLRAAEEAGCAESSTPPARASTAAPRWRPLPRTPSRAPSLPTR